MWTVELVVAAEHQGLDIYEVPAALAPTHHEATSRFRVRDALVALREIIHLVAYRDDYRPVYLGPERSIASAVAGADADLPYAGAASRRATELDVDGERQS
jgi:hypothetical protein